jgi:hypothetical protein
MGAPAYVGWGLEVRALLFRSESGPCFSPQGRRTHLETEAMASFLRQGPGTGAGGLLPGRLSAAFRGSALPYASQSPCRVPGAGAGAFAAAPSPLAAPPGWAAGFHATAAACKQKFTGIVVSDKMNKSGAAARAHGQTGVRAGRSRAQVPPQSPSTGCPPGLRGAGTSRGAGSTVRSGHKTVACTPGRAAHRARGTQRPRLGAPRR